MQAPSDLAQSRIQVLSTSLAVVQPLSKAGRIKVLAVTSRQRAPSAPEVPTAAEAGYPALTFESIGGVFGPRDMADKLRESIAADFQKIAEDPIIAKRYRSNHVGPRACPIRRPRARAARQARHARQDTGRQSGAIGLCFRGDGQDSLSQRTTSFS